MTVRAVLRLLVPVVALLVLTPGASFAAWTTTGSGIGAAAATTVGQPGAPSVVAGPSSATVTWSVTKTGSGVSAGSYDVYRHAGAGSTLICSMVTTTTCTDASPLASTVQYGVVARVGANWRGPESALTSFTYDLTAPTTTLSTTPSAPNGAGWFSSNVTVTLTASDTATSPNSGVASIRYSLNGGATQTVSASSTSISVTAEQANTLTYWAVDNNGNTETTNSAATIKIDKTVPTTTISPASSATWRTTATSVTLTGSDTYSGVASTKYRIDGGTLTTYAGAFALTDGAHTVTYYSTDNAGNVETTNSATIKVDTVLPTSSASPVTGTTPRTVTLTGTDATSGVASIVYKIDSGTTTTVNASSASVSILAGVHTLTWHAVDAAGNAEADRSAIYGDVTAPTVVVTYPTNGSTVKNNSWGTGCTSLGLCGTASDNSGGSGLAAGAAKYELRKTGATPTCWTGSAFTAAACGSYQTASGTMASWNIAMAFASLPTGTFELRVLVTDLAGNSNRPTSSPSGTADVSFTK